MNLVWNAEDFDDAKFYEDHQLWRDVIPWSHAHAVHRHHRSQCVFRAPGRTAPHTAALHCACVPQVIPQADLDYINTQLDPEVMKHFGLEVRCPRAAHAGPTAPSASRARRDT